MVPLDLDLSNAVGAMKSICTVEILGILEPDDLAAALDRGTTNAPELPAPRAEVESEDPRDLKRIREKHHSVARLIASGMTQRMVAALSGYTESYISVLLDSPAMVELVTLYRTNYTSGAEVIGERLRTAGATAVEKLLDKMAINDESLTNQELIAIAKLGLDRSGHGPSSKQHHVVEQHLFDHKELLARDRDARAGSAARIIEHVPASQPAIESSDNAGD